MVTPLKIYIKNYKPEQVSNKLNNLHVYLGGQEKHVEILASDGYFIIEHNKIIKIHHIDKDIIQRQIDDITLLIDPTITQKEVIFSQIPYHHVYLERDIFYFSSNPENYKKGMITLVVEGYYMSNSSFGKKPTLYENFKPTDIYFITKESVDNILLIKELNVFLSILK